MKDIHLPMSEADARSLKLGEMITVSGLLFTGRSRFHIRAIEDKVFPPIDYEKINQYLMELSDEDEINKFYEKTKNLVLKDISQVQDLLSDSSLLKLIA